MKPLHPTRLAVAIRNICNGWPAFAHVKPAGRHIPDAVLQDGTIIDFKCSPAPDDEDARLAHQRQRLAYKQSLGK